MVEFAGQRRDHPILAKQHSQRLDIDALVALQRDQIADLVIAIGDIDRAVAVPNLAVAEIKLAPDRRA